MEVSDPRARLAALSSAWPWILLWSTFARRWNCLVVGVRASKACTLTAFCAFRQALLCSASRDRALVCSGSSYFRRHPSQVINLSTDTIVPRSCSRCDLALVVSTSASGARSRRHSFPQLSTLPLGCVPRGQWAPGTSSTAYGRCSRNIPIALVLPELLIPSCSCRSCHKEKSPHSPMHLGTLMHWFV